MLSARIMQTGRFVHVKDIDSHSVRALLASRTLLVRIKRDLENHVRGLLKNLGLVIGRATFNVFALRAEELIEDRPDLVAAVRPLLEARNAVAQQVSELDRKVMKLARRDAQVHGSWPYLGSAQSQSLHSRQQFRSGTGRAIEKCGCLCRVNEQAPRFRRDRLEWSHLEVW